MAYVILIALTLQPGDKNYIIRVTLKANNLMLGIDVSLSRCLWHLYPTYTYIKMLYVLDLMKCEMIILYKQATVLMEKKRFVTKRYRIPEFSEKEAVDGNTKSPLLIFTWTLRVLWK